MQIYFPNFAQTQKFVAFDSIVQTKQKNYCNQHPIDLFLPLRIEIF